MTFAFSGPSPNLFLAINGGMLIGGLYSTIAKTNPLPILIFAIRELADYILYRLAEIISHASDDRSRAKVYAVTNLTVNVATLLLLRQLDLIGRIGTQIFLGLMAIETACKYADFSLYRVNPVE
jgi:hypothetical protein